MRSRMKMRTLVVDGEHATREMILEILEKDGGIETVGECQNGTEGIAAIEDQEPDLILLDVALSGIDGFQMLDQVEQAPHVIVVTSSDTLARRAYEINAIDYLLKPLDGARLRRALQRAKSTISHKKIAELALLAAGLLEHHTDEEIFPDPLLQGVRRPYLKQLPLKKQGRVAFLKVSAIDWIEGASQYARLHFGKKSHLLRESLKTFESELDPQRFMRIHRSTIVNLERIRELEVDPPVYGVVLKNGTRLKTSRRRCAKLQTALTRIP